MTDLPSGVKLPTSESYPLEAVLWRRTSTQEWVLEITGTINDCAFVCRHTEPLTTAPEDVAGLPSLYAAQPTSPALPTDELHGKNPWPEDSDYGKLWRRGYQAGRSDLLKEFAPKIVDLAMQAKAPATSLGGVGLVAREQSLQAIGDVIEYWLKWVTRERDAEGLATEADTHIMFGYENAPPHWPSVGQLTNWLDVIRAPAALAQPTVAVEGLVEAARDLIDVIDSVDDEAEYTKEEWAAFGSAKLHAEDRIRAALSQPSSPADLPQLTPEEEDALVEEINGRENLQPLPSSPANRELQTDLRMALEAVWSGDCTVDEALADILSLPEWQPSSPVSSNEDAEWLRQLTFGSIVFSEKASDRLNRIANTLEAKPVDGERCPNCKWPLSESLSLSLKGEGNGI